LGRDRGAAGGGRPDDLLRAGRRSALPRQGARQGAGRRVPGGRRERRAPAGERELVGGFGGTLLVAGVRWPFRGKDAGRPNSGLLLGRLRTPPRGGQRGPAAQTRFRRALLSSP